MSQKYENLYAKENLTNVHDPSKCEGEHCCIHNPSAHHMANWPQLWRQDKGVMERICPHGIGHPDPDDAAYNRRIGKDYLSIHGCDGCCRAPLAKSGVPGEET